MFSLEKPRVTNKMVLPYLVYGTGECVHCCTGNENGAVTNVKTILQKIAEK